MHAPPSFLCRCVSSSAARARVPGVSPVLKRHWQCGLCHLCVCGEWVVWLGEKKKAEEELAMVGWVGLVLCLLGESCGDHEARAR